MDEPTPEQIRLECKAIQAGWSKREEMKRRGVLIDENNGRRVWTVPTAKIGSTERGVAD